MNKKELFEAVIELPVNCSGSKSKIDKLTTLELIKLLDESQKVTIPQFVAEHIKHAKEIGRDLQDAMNSSSIHKEVDEWLYTDNNMELFARAWLDGYEVEKEKKYKIVMLNIASSGGVLTHIKHDDSWIWIDTLGTIVERRTHTRKELEDAGFGWVFDCEGVEVEELEE